MMRESPTGAEYLLRALKLAGSAAHTHLSQRSDIGLGVDPAVEVAAYRRDAAVGL
jgi:hypothetical protein